jgi:hypothetical protein
MAWTGLAGCPLDAVFSIASGDGRWVAVGAVGPDFGGRGDAPDGTTVVTSVDTVSWDVQTTPLDGDSPSVAVGYGIAFVSDAPPPSSVSYSRVYGIELTLTDDGVEQVSRLVTSQDGF